ncbi:MAG: LysR family transcriptional regulator [Leptonema illini]|uniref:LysR family transcriptional regulator n=1 Tax=Leptonema illini TaxID=183 RepID=A0A833M1M9_9LEPT|nr:MAG: LysR family transcriptional regulator [Leptonema illini]
MTLTQLRYIVAVDRYGSFVEAAQHCLVTQPTLSLQIQKLEHEIGVELFDRRKTPVVTTAAGRKIIEQARTVLREAGRLEELFREDEDELVGELRIALIPTLAPVLMPELFRSLSRNHPHLQFRIYELPTSQIIEKIRHDEMDIGILATPLKEDDLTEIPLYYEPFVAYYPKGVALPGPIELRNLDLRPDGEGRFEMILLGEDHCFRNQSLQLCGSRSAGRIECGSLETLKKMVDLGAGMTLLPQLAAPKNDPRVVALKDPQPTREISLVHGPYFFRRKLLDAVKQLILSRIPPELKTKKGRDLIGVQV